MCLCAFCLKVSSSKWPILCRVGRQTLLTHSLAIFTNNKLHGEWVNLLLNYFVTCFKYNFFNISCYDLCWLSVYSWCYGLCRIAVMSGGQCTETETESDGDDDDENSLLTYSLTQNADTALATSVTSYHRHCQPSGGMSTFCHILKHMFYLNLNLTSQHK